jgi:elongation factor 1-beta
MADAIFKIKIMPDSPDADLEAIESAAKKIVEKEQGRSLKITREPIAFGLNAMIFLFLRDETLDQDILTDSMREIDHVSSAEIIDFRRAFG